MEKNVSPVSYMTRETMVLIIKQDKKEGILVVYLQ
jgi:hypothetical protein